MSIRRIEILAAYLIALAAVELSSDIVDVLGLPVPRQLFGMSWSSPLAVAAVLLLWPLSYEHRKRILGIWDAAYLAMVSAWILSAAFAGELGRIGTLSAILAWLSPWMVTVAVRVHLREFNSIDALLRPFTIVVVCISVAHLVALVLIGVHVTIPFVRPDELVDRNGISLLVVAVVVMTAMRDARVEGRASWLLLVLIALGFVHARINGTRSAELALTIVLVLQFLRATVLPERVLARLCIALCIGTIVAIVSAAAILEWLGIIPVFGAGDAAASTSQRVLANRDVLRMFLASPWWGIGWDEAIYTRSGGHVTHTLFVLMPAAYGIVPLVPIALASILRGRRNRAGALTTEVGFAAVLVTVVASFVNDPLPWYGMVIPLSIAMSRKNFSRLPVGNDSPIMLSRVRIHARRYGAAGALTAFIVLAVSCGWFLQRDRYIAHVDVEIGRTGAYALQAVESSRDAEQYVQDAVLRHDPALRDACSISAPVDRQALVVACKGNTADAAVLAARRIVDPVIQRQQQSFEQGRLAAQYAYDMDRLALRELGNWAPSLGTDSEPAHGTRVNAALLTFLNLQRARLNQDLWKYSLVRKMEHPTRIQDGIRLTQRRPRWTLAIALSAVAGIGVVLMLALGAAAAESRSA